MKTKKTVLLLAVLMVAALGCCSCSTQASYTGGEVCAFTPHQKQFRAKKPLVHPAPDTPIGGDYMRY